MNSINTYLALINRLKLMMIKLIIINLNFKFYSFKAIFEYVDRQS